VIDNKRDIKGRFILTGSSSPDLIAHLSDSLAGRIAILRLCTLKTNEYFQKPLSDFYNIFHSSLDKTKISFNTPSLTNDNMRHIWLNGGYPEPLVSKDNDFLQQWMQNYQDTYINRDIAHLFPKLNRHAYQRFLSTLSRLSSTIINKSDIARAIEISEGAIREYLQIADATFLWRKIPYFTKNPLKSLVKKPKGYIRDSGLLHYLLKINNLDSLLLSPTVGHSFEGFVIEEIVEGLEATNITNWDISFYRTYNGAEIDLIIDGPFGTLPIEIKMSTHVPMKKLKSLIQFVQGENKNPTVDNIRLILQTGSKSTIARYLKEWRQSENIEGPYSSSNSLPEELLSLVKGLWLRLQEKSDNQVQNIQKDYE